MPPPMRHSRVRIRDLLVPHAAARARRFDPEGILMRFPSALLCLAALAAPAAAQTDVTSAIDAVTVYPDGATVTRVIHVDLPRGEVVLRARDFPPGLDPASLRVEGEAQARLVIGGIDARPPRADR